VDMRSELFVARFTDAQHQPELAFYNAKVACRHKKSRKYSAEAAVVPSVPEGG
jgi:hypothetical protein